MSKRKSTTFDIVHFIDADDDNGKKSIDCVSSSWIFVDKKVNKIMTKFMSPPYTQKKCNDLHSLIKMNGDASHKWPSYAVKILESAGTYSEALSKIEKLKDEDYICTTDKENENIEIEKKHKIPTIYDMKGNLSICRNFSSTDSSTENEAEEIDPLIETINKKHKRSHLIKQKYEESEEVENILKTFILQKEPAAQVMEKSTRNLASNNATSTNIFKCLKIMLSRLEGLKYDQEIIKNDVHTLKEKFEHYLVGRNNENEGYSVHWTKQNNIQWPLKNKQDLDRLNELLQNENIRNDFMRAIDYIIDSTTPLSKNLLAVIRKFLHQDLTTKLTCVKQIKDKLTLKPSLFYDCIIEVFCAKRENIQQKFSEKTLEKLIGVILTNSKDWGKKHFQRIDIAIEEHEVEENEDRSEEGNE